MSPLRRIALLTMIVSLFLLVANTNSSGALVQAQASPGKQIHPFTLLSPNFRDGELLPLRSEGNVGCTGKNIAPGFLWKNVPAQTSSFALLMNDVDAPVSGGFHHWITYNIPATARTLHGNAPFTQGTNGAQKQTYTGPCPPATGQRHHYIFTLYALNTAPSLPAGLTYEEVLQAINGKVLGATAIVGIFFLDPSTTNAG